MAEYTVGRTRQIDKPIEGGGVMQVYRVWLTTANQNTGHVDVALSDWNEERLREILDAKAAELDLANHLE